MQQDAKVFPVVAMVTPPTADEEAVIAWHIAAHAVDLDDALDLAEALQIPRAAFARAREQGP